MARDLYEVLDKQLRDEGVFLTSERLAIVVKVVTSLLQDAERAELEGSCIHRYSDSKFCDEFNKCEYCKPY